MSSPDDPRPPAAVEPAVELADVHAAPCLVGFTLRVAAGERVALVGPNGVGKTTLLRLVAKLARPTRGAVRASDSVGYLPQDYRASFLPWLRADRNVLLALEARGALDAAARARLDVLLDALGVDRACLAKYPQTLSGGQQQLLALARALVGRPRLLLLDEPFAALDAAHRALARTAVVEASRQTGATLLLVSHDLEDVASVAERVVALDGRPARVTTDAPTASVATAPLARLAAGSLEEA